MFLISQVAAPRTETFQKTAPWDKMLIESSEKIWKEKEGYKDKINIEMNMSASPKKHDSQKLPSGPFSIGFGPDSEQKSSMLR